jgi:hypothetical protein
MNLTEKDILDMTAPEFTKLQRLVESCKRKRRVNAMAKGITPVEVRTMIRNALSRVMDGPYFVLKNLKSKERIGAYLKQYGKPSAYRDFTRAMENLYFTEGLCLVYASKTAQEKFNRAVRQLTRVADSLELPPHGDLGPGRDLEGRPIMKWSSHDPH